MTIEPQNGTGKTLTRAARELRNSTADLATIIGGKSIIDAKRLFIADSESARAFIRAYGFDPDDSDDLQVILYIRDRALSYVTDKLLPYAGIIEVPAAYYDMSIEAYLIEASRPETAAWPNWSCALLKVIHCAAHALYTQDTEAHAVALSTIRERFLPFISEVDGQKWIGDAGRKIKLLTFEIKEHKNFSRTMTKLLHKPGNLAFEIFDRLGVRFVVDDIDSVLLLIDFLRSRYITMYANNLPERTRTSLAELEGLLKKSGDASPDVMDQDAFPDESVEVESDLKNPFSHHEFQVLQFTERLMVSLSSGRRTVFPYEIQILDRKSWERSQQGDASHAAYEQRQIDRVRRRIFGVTPKPGA